MADWLARDTSWSLFATYTFDERKGRQPRTADHALERVFGFLGEVDRGGRPGVTAICFAEPHRSGFWHAHGVIALPFGLLSGDVRALHRLWFTRRGYCRFEPPRSGSAVSRYLAKYLTKERAEWSVYPSPAGGWSGTGCSTYQATAATDG